MNVIETIRKRETTKVYKDGPEVTDEQLNQILEAAHLSPSSNDLQNSRILVLRTPESRKKYKKYFAGFNADVLDGAKMVFILIGNPWKNYKKDKGKYFIEAAMGDRNQSMVTKTLYAKKIFAYYDLVSEYTDTVDITTTDIQFAFMDLVATDLGFDSTPMGGLDKSKLEKFMIKEGTMKEGERVNLAFAIGYADENSKKNIDHTRHRIDIKKIYEVI